MSDLSTLDAYGVVDDATLTIKRLLPGPIERCWDYLTDSDLRRKWLAAGRMEMKVGAPFTFTWRNAEISDPPSERPEGAAEEHSMDSTITELDPPRRLSIAWGSTGGVTFELEPQGDKVLLTLTHRRVPDRSTLLNVSAGWHAHLDALVTRANGKSPTPFWEHWTALKAEYDRRLPA